MRPGTEARETDREREREAGAEFAREMREALENGAPTLEDLTGRGRREGRDDDG